MMGRKAPHMMWHEKNRNVKVVPAGWGGVNSPFRNSNVPTEDKTWIVS